MGPDVIMLVEGLRNIYGLPFGSSYSLFGSLLISNEKISLDNYSDFFVNIRFSDSFSNSAFLKEKKDWYD